MRHRTSVAEDVESRPVCEFPDQKKGFQKRHNGAHQGRIRGPACCRSVHRIGRNQGKRRRIDEDSLLKIAANIILKEWIALLTIESIFLRFPCIPPLSLTRS